MNATVLESAVLDHLRQTRFASSGDIALALGRGGLAVSSSQVAYALVAMRKRGIIDRIERMGKKGPQWRVAQTETDNAKQPDDRTSRAS